MRLRSLIFFLAITVLAGNFVFAPKKTEATGVPVVDVVANGIEGTSLIKDIAQWIKEDAFAALRDVAAKRIIDSMVKDTVEWIGGNGNPKFITDWEKFLKDSGDAAVGDVIRETDLAFICSPFKAQLQFALQPTQLYKDRIECTLSEALYNIDEFYNDFSNGGWIAYQEVWAPNNNYLGSLIIAQDEIISRSAKAEDAAKSDAVASGGFISLKKKGECLEYATKTYENGLTGYDFNNCIKRAPDEIINPGASVGEIAANALGAEGEWATNISSWTSVLVNALINRVTKEGVDFAGKAVSGSGSDKTISTADNFQDLIDRKNDSDNQNMISELQRFLDFDWDYFSQLKNESLVKLKENYAMSLIIDYKKSLDSSVACNLPFGFQYRPKSLERQVKQFTSDVQNLEEYESFVITQVNGLKTEIGIVVNPEERLKTQQRYNDFITQNNLEDISSAEQEWQDFDSVLATLWKEFDRPECYYPEFYRFAGDGQKYLSDFADKLLEGKTVLEILSNPGN
jgi:hypothetical protein